MTLRFYVLVDILRVSRRKFVLEMLDTSRCSPLFLLLPSLPPPEVRSEQLSVLLLGLEGSVAGSWNDSKICTPA